MKSWLLLILTGCIFFFTGCLDVLEEIAINKDGSGKYKISFDMSQLFTDPMMKGMFEEMIKSEGKFELSDDGKLEMDTVILFSNTPNLPQAKDHQNLWQSAKMQMIISESKKKVLTTIAFDFKEVEEIDYFFKTLEKTQAEDQSGLLSNPSILPSGGLFTFKKKSLTRLPMPKADMATGDDTDMLIMLLADATYKTIYRMPGKVKKVSIPNAVIEGKIITVTIPLTDVMEGKARLDGEIKFKN